MNAAESAELAVKIAALVQEQGWTQEEFAERAGLNRLTARKILLHPGQAGRLHNATVVGCARALGLSVAELRRLPVSRLQRAPDAYERASQPRLQEWLERHPDRAGRLSPAEIDELYSLQGTGGPLTDEGIEHFIDQIERRRKLVAQVETLAGTEYLDLLEKLVAALYEQVQLPAGDAARKRGQRR
jgi:transcriptional regulator with XRE-family HTH domain